MRHSVSAMIACAAVFGSCSDLGAVQHGIHSVRRFPLPRVSTSERPGIPRTLFRLRGGGAGHQHEELPFGDGATVEMMSGYSDSEPRIGMGDGGGVVSGKHELGGISRRVQLRRRKNQIRRRNVAARKQAEREEQAQEIPLLICCIRVWLMLPFKCCMHSRGSLSHHENCIHRTGNPWSASATWGCGAGALCR